MTISTSVWSAQHPNAGRNIQQVALVHDFKGIVSQKTIAKKDLENNRKQ